MTSACRRTVFAIGLLAAILWTGCGAGSKPIAITLSSAAAALDQSSQATTLTATVTNDSSNSGATFSTPTCGTPAPAAGCGTVSNVQTSSGGVTTATYTPPAASSRLAGPIQVSISATSKKDASKTSTAITIAVNPDPAVSGTFSATIGQSCNTLVTGGKSPYTLTATIGSVPGWMNFNTSNGAICAGNIPNNATSSSFTAKVTDSLGVVSGATAVTITVPIVITTASPLATGEIGQPGYSSGALAFMGGSGMPAASNPWSVTSGGATLTAAGLTFSASNGAVTGTPSATCAPCSFTVQLKDSLGATGSLPFSLTIVPRVAVANPSSGLGATIGSAYSLALSATAGTGQSPYSNWTVSSGALPAGLTLNPSTGVISSNTGPTDASTTPSFTVTAKDSLGVLSLPSAPITISVAIPITTASLPVGEVSAAYSAPISANTGTGTTIAWSATGLPGWASMNAGTGAISGASPVAGSVPVTVMVSDHNGASGSAQLNLTVNPELTITSSGALAGGVVNTPYNGGTGVTLQDTGGVSPLGNWSGPESGSLPPGLTVTSGGIIQGTPVCPTGNYNFTVKRGPDADGVTAVSPGLTITTTSTSLAISTTSLPNAKAGQAYSQQLASTGGACSASVTWSVSNGSLPGWLTLDSTGLLHGTPATGDVGGPTNFTVQATDGVSTPTQALGITVATSGGSDPSGIFVGTYAFLLRGFDANGKPIVLGGSFTPDGTGNISYGVMDVNSFSGGVNAGMTINPSGSYYSANNQRGSLTLDTSAGSYNFDFSWTYLINPVTGKNHITHGYIISTTPNSSISGTFVLQDTTAFNLTAITGDWAFLSSGASSSSGSPVPSKSVGRFTVHGDASISAGAIDVNDNGTINGGLGSANPLTFTGSVSGSGTIDSQNGRGTNSFTIASGSTIHQAFYIVNSGQLFVVSTDPLDATHAMFDATAQRQSTTFCPTTGSCNFATNPTPLAGKSVVYLQGNSSTAGQARVQLGLISFGSTGAGTGGLSGGFDENDAGTFVAASGNPVAGNYAVAANGRVTLSNVGNNPPVLYVVGQGTAFLLGTDSKVEEGGGVPQLGGPYSYQTGTGGYYQFGTTSPSVSGTQVFDGLNLVMPSSNTSANATGNIEDTPGANGVAVADYVVTMDATGRFTYTVGGKARVGYYLGSSANSVGSNFDTSIVIDANPGDNLPFMLVNSKIITEVVLP